MNSKKYWIALLIVSAISLWLRSGFPVTALPYAKHDDQLFVRLAHYLATGHWLGPYDNLTLAKGPFYSMFMAVAFWAEVPLKMAEQFFYLLACTLTAWVLRRFAGNRVSLILFTLLAFNPVMWNPALARVIRQPVYMSVALGVVTLTVIVCFPSAGSLRRRPYSLMLGVALGLVGAAYWLTREEGLWLVPSIAIVVAVAVLGIVWPSWSRLPDSKQEPSRSSRLKAIAIPLAVAVITFTAADFSVAFVNYTHYGVFETNEFRDRNFVRAYGALSRIQHDHPRHLISIPESTWQHAYSVSPAARELAPYMEGSTRELWLQVTCKYGTIKPCDDVQIGYDMWELRDAVASAGHAKSGADAMRFYGDLANQIDAACDNRQLSCLPPRASMQPPFRLEYLKLALRYAKPTTAMVFAMMEGPPVAVPSVGHDDELALFDDTIDDVYPPERSTVVIRGWVAGATAPPAVRVENRTGEAALTSITVSPAPDVEKVYPSLKSYRFELRTDCPLTSCDLVVDTPGLGPAKFSLSSVMNPGPLETSGPTRTLVGFLDASTGGEAFPLRHHRQSLQMRIANLIARIYAYWFPRMGGVAAIGLLLAFCFRRHFPLPDPLVALALASAVAVLTYIALMSYIKASVDMNVITILYLSPSSPFVITFTTLGFYSWYVALRTWALGGEPRQAAFSDSLSGNIHSEQPI